MDFNEYQLRAKATDIYPANHALDCHVHGLNNEAGEVAGKIKKIYRDHNGEFSPMKKVEIAKELGDTLWYLSMVALDLGFSLESIATINIQKLADRKERGQISGSGDER